MSFLDKKRHYTIAHIQTRTAVFARLRLDRFDSLRVPRGLPLNEAKWFICPVCASLSPTAAIYLNEALLRTKGWPLNYLSFFLGALAGKQQGAPSADGLCQRVTETKCTESSEHPASSH